MNLQELDIPRLNCDIERFIDQWEGTYRGMEIKNMYENVSSYESICDRLNWDINDYMY